MAFTNIEDRDVCHAPIEDHDAAEGGGSEAAVLKAMREKYVARQKTMEGTIEKLVSLLAKIDAAIKALSCCFVFAVVC